MAKSKKRAQAGKPRSKVKRSDSARSSTSDRARPHSERKATLGSETATIVALRKHLASLQDELRAIGHRCLELSGDDSVATANTRDIGVRGRATKNESRAIQPPRRGVASRDVTVAEPRGSEDVGGVKIHARYVRAAQEATAAEDLFELLQQAIRLEHATIPPYLTAAYSLKMGINSRVRNLILDVAVEEMLHMTIVANVLNAIGGKPSVSDPSSIPQYPGPLPMSIGNSLTVGLRKCSLELIRDTFMKIEKPEQPIILRARAITPEMPEFATIGQFYLAIIAKIEQLGEAIFMGDPARQVVSQYYPAKQLFSITNVDTAVRALTWIINEGEGTSTIPFDDEGEPAHYYRFESILRGKELVPDSNDPQGYSYSGPVIRFEPAEVWDFLDDTKASDYPAGSEERRRVDAFNQAYSELLRGLQASFDGQPKIIDDVLVPQMGMLRGLATAVVSRTNPLTGRQCGLTFEYMP